MTSSDPASSESAPQAPEAPAPGVDEVDTEPLERAQQAVDEGNEAAREVAESDPIQDDLEIPGAGGDADADQGEVTPRPS